MTTSTSDPIEELIRAEAQSLGFDLCRFTDIDEAWPAAARLGEFVDAGRHGEMGWMAETVERRRHPRAMWSHARSASGFSRSGAVSTNTLSSPPNRACSHRARALSRALITS